MEKTVRIRELNDSFRRTFIGGRVLITQGVDALSDDDKLALLAKVRAFDDFNRDNDPHGQHDFFGLEHDGVMYFGKIDYYAPDLQSGSENPADPSRTVRVLTIMLSHEY